MKWAIIAILFVFALIAGFEVVRHMGAEEAKEPAPAGFGETGTGAAVAEHLKGNAWEKPEGQESGPPAEEEFDRAGEILDSREEDLQKAKNKTRVFINAINNN